MRRPAARLATAALLLTLCACGPKKYVLLSPEDDYSDDPSLSVEVEAVQLSGDGRTEVIALLGNKGSTPLAIGEADVVLLDADEKTMPLLAKPDVTIEPGEEKTISWAFDTTGAAKGALEMKLLLEGKKIWPIIFSTDKPSDFRESPVEGPQGPQGRPPF